MSVGWDMYLDEKCRREKAEAKLGEYSNALVEEANQHRDTKAKLAETEAALRQASKMHGTALAEVERLRAALRGALGAWDQHHKATPETEHHQIKLARAAMRGGGE